MISKSGNRFSDKIMLKRNKPDTRPTAMAMAAGAGLPPAFG
jgi:hypothetical protein